MYIDRQTSHVLPNLLTYLFVIMSDELRLFWRQKYGPKYGNWYAYLQGHLQIGIGLYVCVQYFFIMSYTHIIYDVFTSDGHH